MGKKNRTKLPDPHAALQRQERIRTMRAKETAALESLDRVLRSGKDLGDRVHYDTLLKAKADEIPTLVEHITTARAQAVESVGQCGIANYELTRECERLQAQLDRLEGRHPSRTHWTRST